MFSLNKRFIAGLLIIAMTISNAGMSTLAVSISHYVDNTEANKKDDSDITYRYYEEYRYSYESKTTLLMNSEAGAGEAGGDGGIEDKAEQGLAGDSAENPVANENETGISEETDSSDFDVENNESENKEDKESETKEGVDPNDIENETELTDYDEEPEEDETSVGASTASPDDESETVESETETSTHETREYDEEFGPKQEESKTSEEEETSESETSEEETSESKTSESEISETGDSETRLDDIASESEISESEIDESETSETETTTETRPGESTPSEIIEEEKIATASDAEVANEEKIATASDIEEATMSELLPELDKATMSKTKLLGAGVVHTITNGWYGTQRGGLYIYNVTKLKITNTEPTTSSFSWDIDTTGLKGYVVNGTEVDIYFPEGDTLKLGSPTNYLQGVFSNNHYSNIFSGVRKFEGLELLDVSDTTSLASLFSDLGSLVDTSGWSEDDFDYWDLSSWDVSNVSSLYSVFSKVKILGKVNLKGWKHNVNVGRSDFMFSECSNLKTILTGEYDLSNVYNTASMFLWLYIFSWWKWYDI